MSKEANPLAVGMGFQPGKFMKPEPVFRNCNVCGRELILEEELAVGACGICMEEQVPVKPKKKTEAHSYAERLAYSIWKQHYSQDSPEWKALPDLLGVLTQIDNMVAGMSRKPKERVVPVGLIPLSENQKRAIQQWAADDRLWTTQETVALNLETFARLILKLSSSVEAAQPSENQVSYGKDPYEA